MSAIPPLVAADWDWPEGVVPMDGGVCAPAGFAAAGVAAGIKKSRKRDVALVVADEPAIAAGVFTKNAFAAPPVHLTRTHIARGPLKAVVVNSGNANACNGPRGMEDAVTMAKLTAERLGCSPWEVAVASTGVIGVPMPMDAVAKGIEMAADGLGGLGGLGSAEAAEAIMTTDTFPKEVAVEVDVGSGVVRIGAMAKGSGMIKPDMATMLAFVTTDARLGAEQAGSLLRAACDASFNRVTVDGETSTNDCVLFLASGGADSAAAMEPGSPHEHVFASALDAVTTFLAQQIVRDGEGATKLIAVKVGGAVDEAQAVGVAFAVAESPLVKTALFGQDANWGRVLSAIGASGTGVDPDVVKVSFGPHVVAERGARADADESSLAAYLKGQELELGIDLGMGGARATVCTTDLSYDYVRINAEYRT